MWFEMIEHFMLRCCLSKIQKLWDFSSASFVLRYTSHCQEQSIVCLFIFLALQHIVVFSTARWRALASSFSRFLDHIQRRATVGRTPLDEWSIRRGDLYLTTHNNQNRQTFMPSVGFEPTISAGGRPKTYALDRTATGTGIIIIVINGNYKNRALKI